MSDASFTPLTKYSQPGDMVYWKTVDGVEYRGFLIEIDNGTAIVLCSDGKQRSTTVG